MLISALPSFSRNPTKSVWREFSTLHIWSPLISDQVRHLQPPWLLWTTLARILLSLFHQNPPYPFSDFPSTDPQLAPWLYISTCPCIWNWAQFWTVGVFFPLLQYFLSKIYFYHFTTQLCFSLTMLIISPLKCHTIPSTHLNSSSTRSQYICITRGWVNFYKPRKEFWGWRSLEQI